MKMTKSRRDDWKKPKFEELKHSYPEFNYDISIFITETLVTTANYISNRDYLVAPRVNNMDTAEAFTINGSDGYSLMYFMPDADINIITHESYHAVTALLKYIGADRDEEIVACLLGDLVGIAAAFQKQVREA